MRLFLASGAAAADPYVLPAGAGQGATGLRLVIDISSSAAPPLAVDGGVAAPDVDPNYDAPGLRTIVLDPGHGGAERGAIGPAGTEEKELTLILAKALKRKLEERLAVAGGADAQRGRRSAARHPHRARQPDQGRPLHLDPPERRSGVVGARRRDLLPGAQGDRRARAPGRRVGEPRPARAASADGGAGDAGLQLLLWDLAQSQHLAASQSLAQLIQQELNTTLGLTDRGVRQAPFAVLVGATMPAVLVELGFITNPKEEERLLDPAYRADLLDAVVRAVVRFKSMVDGGTESAAVAVPPPG